jgi:hypothetical protein
MDLGIPVKYFDRGLVDYYTVLSGNLVELFR